MLSVGVVDEHSFTRGCVIRLPKDFDGRLEVIPFESSEECLGSTSALDVILYHEHENDGDSHDIRLGTLKKLLEIAPVIILSAANNPESVIEAFESGVRGYSQRPAPPQS